MQPTSERRASGRADLLSYAAVATSARSATEALGPALLLAALASGRIERDGALVLAAFTGLAALSGPLVGALLDRVARPGRVIGLATVVLAVVVAAMAVLMPTAPLLPLVAIAAIGGFAHPALTGGLTSQLPNLVSGDQLDRAYGVDAATYNIGAIVGPPLAAAALVLGHTGPIVFTLALLLVALALVPRLPFATREPGAPRHSFRRDLTTGFRGLAGTPTLASATITTTVGFAGQAAFLVATPLVALNQTGSLAASGWIFGAAAAGGVLSTLWLIRWPLRDPDRAVVAATVVVGLGVLVMAASPTLLVTVTAAFVFGAADGPMLTAIFRIRTRDSVHGIRAQVFTTASSLRTSVYAAMTAVFGAAIGMGASRLLVIGGVIQFLAIALAWLLTQHRATAAASTVASPRRDP